jgi:hypothetical protein
VGKGTSRSLQSVEEAIWCQSKITTAVNVVRC